MKLSLFRRRTIWFPTFPGWLCILGAVLAPLLLWWFGAEAFLTTTHREPASILILETWTQGDGAEAAAIEFGADGRHYDYMVLAGGMTGERWSRQRWDTVAVAERILRRAGVAAERLVLAASPDVPSHRTYETAVAARRALEDRGLHPMAVNVFTRAAHARRSRLVYSKVFGPGTEVGVIAWVPAGSVNGPWWHSSNRAEEVIKESIAYAIELLLNSGR